ncbi:MAG: cache domain-containing protein [Candidatus Hodarchaeota archaeon]
MKTYFRPYTFLEDSEDWKAIMIGLIAAIIIISGVVVVIMISNSNKTAILEDTPLRQIEETLHNQALENAKSLDVFFSRIESIAKTVGDYANQIWANNESSGRSTYYHNSTFAAPKDFSYSAKHLQNVSYSYSGYKVANSSYNDESAYMNLPDDQTFGDWPLTVNNTIQLSADLDFIFRPMYEAMDEIIWIYMGFDVGVHRSYPYHGPYSKDYDPRIRPWYLIALDTPTGDGAFTTPYVDASSGKVIVTSSYPVRDQDNKIIGVVGIDFKLTTIQSKVMGINVQKFGRSFLINRDFQVIAHPSHTLPNASWRKTDLEVSITELETTSESFTDLLDLARGHQAVQEIIDYGGTQGQQIVSLVPLNKTDLILGLVLTQPETTAPVIKIFDNFIFLLFIGLDVALMVILVIAFLRYRQLTSEM